MNDENTSSTPETDHQDESAPKTSETSTNPTIETVPETPVVDEKSPVSEPPPVETYTAPPNPPPAPEVVPVPAPESTVVTAPEQSSAPTSPTVIMADPVVVPEVGIPPSTAPSPAASIMVELLKNFKEILLANNGTHVSFQNGARLFGNVVNRMLATPTEELMTVLWTFFLENKNSVMQEGVALRGLEVLDTVTRFKVEMVYTLFRMAGNGVDVGDPKKVNMQMVQSRLKSQTLMLFLQQQARIIAQISA